MKNKNQSKTMTLMIVTSIIIVLSTLFIPIAYEKYIKILILIFGSIITFFYEPMAIVILVLTLTNMLDIAVLETSNSGLTLVDSALAVMICLYIKEYLILKNKTYNKKIIKSFFIISSSIFFLSMCILVAYYKFNQPIYRGGFSFRPNLIILVVFPLYRYIKRNNNYELLIRYCVNIITIACFFVIIQYILGDNVHFLKMNKSLRYDSIRLFMHNASPLMCFAYGYELNNLLNKSIGGKSIKSIAYMAILIFTMFVVVKTRIFQGCYLVISLVLIFIHRNKIGIYKRILFILIIATIFIFQLDNILALLKVKVFGGISTGEDTLYVRINEMKFFREQMGKSYFWGMGIGNIKYMFSPIYIGNILGLFIVDIGIVGYYFEYGVIGIVVFTILIYELQKKYKKYNNGMVSLLVFFVLISTAITVYPNSNGNLIIIIIALIGKLYDISNNYSVDNILG